MKILNLRKNTLKQKPEEFCLNADRMMENLKRALEEMWILSFLNCHDMTGLEILGLLKEKNGNVMNITYPLGSLYLLTKGEYIQEVPSSTKRIYWTITDKGIQYLLELQQKYELFIQTNDAILRSAANENL